MGLCRCTTSSSGLQWYQRIKVLNPITGCNMLSNGLCRIFTNHASVVIVVSIFRLWFFCVCHVIYLVGAVLLCITEAVRRPVYFNHILNVTFLYADGIQRCSMILKSPKVFDINFFSKAFVRRPDWLISRWRSVNEYALSILILRSLDSSVVSSLQQIWFVDSSASILLWRTPN